MKRIFIGSKINLNSDIYGEIRDNFSEVVQGNWVEYTNLHITYKFIGEIEDKYISIIKGLLLDELSTHSVKINMQGVGFFPRASYPKVLFIRLTDNSKKLNEFNQIIENKLFDIDIPKENKKFEPHLTLCRIKNYQSSGISELSQKYKNKLFQSIDTLSINVFESKLTRSGPIYSIL